MEIIWPQSIHMKMCPPPPLFRVIYISPGSISFRVTWLEKKGEACLAVCVWCFTGINWPWPGRSPRSGNFKTRDVRKRGVFNKSLIHQEIKEIQSFISRDFLYNHKSENYRYVTCLICPTHLMKYDVHVLWIFKSVFTGNLLKAIIEENVFLR